MIKGSCCCGVVKFELKAQPEMMGTCHCSRCRKLGSSVMVFIKKDDLVWIAGRDQVALYQPQAPYKYGRCFCKACGTSLGEILSEEDSFPISAQALDDELEIKNQFHEFVAEKPVWQMICDEAKQYEGHPT